MEWIVKITNKPNYKIRVRFQPANQTIGLYGDYKFKNNNWVAVHYEILNADIDLDELQDKLFDIYEAMKKKIEKYNDFSKTFEAIKEIEIVEDDEDDYGIE